MSAETRRQRETTNQNKATNHDDERKMPAIPVCEEEDDEVFSRATTLIQNSVAGAIPPTDMMDVEIATSVPVVRQATRSLGLIVSAVDGGRVDDDTVDRILGEAEDENDDSYASCSVYHPELNRDDDEECPASPMRDILLLSRSVGVDLPAPVVDPFPYLHSLCHEVDVGFEGMSGRLSCVVQLWNPLTYLHLMMHEVEVGVTGVLARLLCVVVAGSFDVHLLYQKRTTQVARLHFCWMLLCGQTIPAFLNSSIRTNDCKYLMACHHQTRWRMEQLWLLLANVEHRPTKTSMRCVLNISLSNQCL
jgi:hypothetical protein